MTQNNRDRLYAARPHPMTHAIIAAMLGREPQTPQRYVGKAIVTSDGFVQCNFVDSNGVSHHSAFVSSYEEIEANVLSVSDLLGIDPDETRQLIASWIAIDYRSARYA